MFEPARVKPDFTLLRTDGRPFHFRAETTGVVALLLFGYTHCPDVCPVHLSNISAVLDRLSIAERTHVRIVFVTTDPDRDTPQQLGSWLANFGPDIVGLRGTTADVHRIETQLGLATSAPEGEGAVYAVGHAAQVLAFTPDDSLRVAYPFGVRQQDWARDIPRLLSVGTLR